ncbi:hypothetical protein ASPZODRAFT_875109 [Penicilliopsis zonata CBS 506.65]|uniref:Transcriptional regulatory protein n=1 Tax=Penicilliopsis zonata CBS 506.65 TaxID=1073090 RepID=A0A1L9S9H2_9EURO|nr:hypothetical protein ASPZODRAFT_875109 [Penicilliopsis zonata CBS 506.65]OJJ43821.1 hypothetical protein ASPZODRAFT_875109 [Penicilliopsis zonata CBS 506.65]
MATTVSRNRSSSVLLSGHSKWSTIKHDKAKNDKAKSKERQLLSKEIASVTQMWGPDPKFNPRLTLALSNAKRAGVPKSVIEAALARGQGKSVSGAALEPVTIEAILPASVAVVIECQTDQKGRVLQDVRALVKNAGGTVTPTTYLFEKKGKITFEKNDGLDLDACLEQVIEAGATDFTTDGDGRLVVYTEPTETKSVGETLCKLMGLTVEELEIFWDPNKDTMVTVEDEEQARELEDALNAICDDPSIQDIYINTSSLNL